MKNIKILNKIKINILTLIDKHEVIVRRLIEANYEDTINLCYIKIILVILLN